MHGLSADVVARALQTQRRHGLCRRRHHGYEDRPDGMSVRVIGTGHTRRRDADVRSQLAPHTRVLALSAHEGDEVRAAMDAAGADGYVIKGTAPADVAKALRGD